MKRLSKYIIMALLLPLVFTSCSSDDDAGLAAPTITNTEFGHDNNKMAYIGGDLHIEADITAPGKIKEVIVEIHSENAGGWEGEWIYTEFNGLLNTTFHKHVEIPEGIAPGEYHLHFIVTDQNGQSTQLEEHIELVLNEAEIEVENYFVEVEDGGNELHVEAEISAVHGIKKVTIEIHGNTYEVEYEYEDGEMTGQTHYHFHKHIDISAAPTGHYHIHLGVEDMTGAEKEFEEHFDKP